MSNIILDKIEFLIRRNFELLNNMDAIFNDVNNSIDSVGDNLVNLDDDYLNSKVVSAENMQKKIQDNTATINYLLSQLKLDQEYFNKAGSMFFKRTQHYSNNISNLLNADTDISINVKFVNAGRFFSWTDDKNIKLGVTIIDSDNNIVSQTFFNLDTSGDNVPGDEETNGDFGKIKTFEEIYHVPLTFSGDYILKLTISDDTTVFDSPYNLNVHII